ncbi:hypothetical protein [uncultured Flavobacterium sp.]|uniref:hypothetical protein n=1 Tax=uncultured Flavobacterium sp. TaxID=165435 RepID=UPI0011FE555D|nr:hypothetical protein [uncultured Flavobacterium sp.]THD32283.1 MAG: hypothetical protein DI588_09335 [Flavobacterium johnsoniae]
MHSNLNDLIASYPVCCSKSKVASENGKRFEINSNEDFTRIRIDGCLIASQNVEKCDFGFVRHSNDDFYFVELKGKEIEKAYNQILNTIDYFNSVIPKEKRFGFIVSSSVPKAGISTNNLKQDFAKKYGRILEIKNKVLPYTPK